MKQSFLFTKTQKNTPKDEVSLNAKLLLRGGFIDKEMAGVYSFLPLGLRVLNKTIRIIREEMDKIGGQELFLTSLQRPEPWQASGRWSDEVMDIWFKTKLKNGTELGLAATHEEPLTELMSGHINSYKDLPIYVYQFQTKFRNEIRSKSGIMRGREFIMKDMYSFCRNKEQHEEFYEKSKAAYHKVFERAGIGGRTYLTFASGGSFSRYSHEFQTLSAAGEDTIYVDKERGMAVNDEVFNDEVLRELGLDRGSLVEEKSIEVGNIFSLGEKYSRGLNLKYLDKEGGEQYVYMGSYGIGPGRLMGTVAELSNDERGIIWPEELAPYRVHLISLKKDKEAGELYQKMRQEGIEVLYDDRDASPGEKFADSDLIGCPYRVVISEKTLKEDSVELKKRSENEFEMVKIREVVDRLKVYHQNNILNPKG